MRDKVCRPSESRTVEALSTVRYQVFRDKYFSFFYQIPVFSLARYVTVPRVATRERERVLYASNRRARPARATCSLHVPILDVTGTPVPLQRHLTMVLLRLKKW